MSLKKETYPIRKCIACGAHSTKDSFVMIVRPPKSSNEKNLSIIDGKDKKSGRGYYVCKNMDCFKKMQKSHRLEKIFSKNCVNTDIYERIKERMLENE